MKVLVTGGYFDASCEGFLDEVNLEDGSTRRLISHTPEAALRVPTKGFTGSVRLDETTLLVCSFNAVHRIDLACGEETGRLTQPDFNDLHSVGFDPETERIYVCNTGLDAIEVFDAAGRFLGRHATSPAWFERERLGGAAVERHHYPELLTAGWRGAGPDAVPRVAPLGDYYQPASSSRDAAGTASFRQSIVRDYLHPNHVVVVDGRLAVTMLASQEVRCLRTHQCLVRTDGHPHDGQIDGPRFWTTTTHGRITAWDRLTAPPWKAVEHYDVFATGFTGWCRGLLVLDDRIVVGLTEMRTQPQYHWSDRPLNATSTSLVVLARGSGRLLHHVQLPERHRHPKIFSLLACPDQPLRPRP